MPHLDCSLTREQLQKLPRRDLQNVAKVRLLPLIFHMRHLPLYFALAKMLILSLPVAVEHSGQSEEYSDYTTNS